VYLSTTIFIQFLFLK